MKFIEHGVADRRHFILSKSRMRKRPRTDMWGAISDGRPYRDSYPLGFVMALSRMCPGALSSSRRPQTYRQDDACR
jgi:hypothetical protein